jgi:hypothetical protein
MQPAALQRGAGLTIKAWINGKDYHAKGTELKPSKVGLCTLNQVDP